jgi:hypothetical protein
LLHFAQFRVAEEITEVAMGIEVGIGVDEDLLPEVYTLQTTIGMDTVEVRTRDSFLSRSVGT